MCDNVTPSKFTTKPRLRNIFSNFRCLCVFFTWAFFSSLPLWETVYDKIYICIINTRLGGVFLLVWCHLTYGLFKENALSLIKLLNPQVFVFECNLSIFFSKILLSRLRARKRCTCNSQKQICLPVLAMMLTFLTKRWQCCKSSISPFNLSSIMSISAISRQIPCQMIQSHFFHVKPYNTV